MHFGAGYFGTSPFGADTDEASVRYLPVPPPPAIFLNPLTRDAEIDSLGRIRGMTPFDQQVAISFMVPRGTVKHAKEIGHDFLTLPRVTGAALQAECERRAAAATPFDRLLASGAATLLGVDVTNPKRTEAGIVIRYKKRGEKTVRSIEVGSP